MMSRPVFRARIYSPDQVQKRKIAVIVTPMEVSCERPTSREANFLCRWKCV